MDPVTIILTLLGIGAGIYGSYKNYQATTETNQANINLQREQYDKELLQSKENWSLQNQFNSPQQQMIRLKQAGLNPNLVYSRGADNTAGSIQQVSKSMPTMNAPRVEVGHLTGLANDYANLKAIQAQTENTQQATLNAKANEDLTKMNTAKVAQDTAKSKFDLEQAKQLKDSVIEGAQLDNKIKAQTLQITMNRDQREAIASSNNTQKTVQEILESEQRIAYQKMLMTNNPKQQEYLQQQIKMMDVAIANAKNDGIYKKWVADLAKMGTSVTDPYSVRLLASPKMSEVANKVGTTIKKAFTPGKNDKPTFQPTKFDNPNTPWSVMPKY